MSNITGLHFYINEDFNLVVDDSRGKTVKHKVISLNTLTKLIDRNAEICDVDSGLLPDRCVSFRECHNGNKYVVLDLGRYNMDLTYEKTKYEDFPIPRLLYGFFLSADNKIEKVRVAVADMGPLRDNTALYMYPFSNVRGFNMCIGANSMPKIKELRQLASIPYYIFAMPDNNDYYSPERTKLNMEYRTMLEFLKDKDEKFYYESVLKRSSKTLKDFIYLKE